MRSSTVPLLAAAAGLTAGLLAARPSRACSPPACWPATVLPAEGATVPANLPALLYAPAANNVTPQPPSTEGFALATTDGAAVALTFEPVPGLGGRQFHARPTQPLVPGRVYRIGYPDACDGYVPGPAKMKMQAFTAGPSVPLPTAIGSARVANHRIEKIRVGTTSGSCTAEITAAVALVAVTPTPELRAYLAVANVGARVGDRSPVSVYREPTTNDGPIEIGIYAGCVRPDRGADPGLAPGTHRLELGATVIGVAAALPPLALDITLDCAGAVDGGAVDAGAPDASVSDAPILPADAAQVDAAAPDAAPADAPADVAAPRPPPPAPTPGSSGCVVAPGSAPGPLALIAALALLRVRRRR